MGLIKCIVILSMCLFLGTCDISDITGNGHPKISIGDYDNQLEAWNSQNMLDYKLRLSFFDREHNSNSKMAFVTVKNSVPESSVPPEWLAGGEKSTIPDFFSFIKEEESSIMNTKASLTLFANYNTVYHYPMGIGKYDRISHSLGPEWSWSIDLILMVDKQQEAWDRLNILDYKLHVEYYDPRNNHFILKEAVITVKDGIPESSEPPEWLAGGEKSTIPDFFSFLKEEETRLEDFIFTPRDYVAAFYNSVYHYPTYIRTDHTWYIKLVLPGESE